MSSAQSFTPLPPEIAARVNSWLQGPYDEESKKEIRRMLDSDKEALIDAFFTDLSFGTGGLRGIMGVGTNRMNRYTVRRTTQGLANYILAQDVKRAVVIGYDSRHHSVEFAQETARVLKGNGIQVFLLKELRPTPFVSFATRYLGCTAGVMITASHNPKEYNGYKVYWSDGAQVVHPHDTGIMQEIEKITSPSQIHLADLPDAPINGKLDAAYLEALGRLPLRAEQNHKHGKELKIAYTSLHGTGITLAPKALAEWGFPTISYVKEQIKPDGDFPTVHFPNPEYKEALQLGIDLLLKDQCDLLIATDPDADRMGMVALCEGKPFIFTGNEIASIFAEYLCRTLTEQKRLPAKSAIVTTIVSTELLQPISQHYHVNYFEVLTGFKYIGEKIHLWETTPHGFSFLFGAEESYGYLYGTHSRDKDAIIATCLMAEVALHAKLHHATLKDYLYDIYRQYGVFREQQLSLNFSPGKEGMDEMASLMARLRSQPPKTLGGQAVSERLDFKNGLKGLPPADVLLFRLADKTRLIIRPSGTEPKIKIYASVSEKNPSNIDNAILHSDQRLDILLKACKKELS